MNFENPICSVILSVKAATPETVWFRNCSRLHYPTTTALETLSLWGIWSFPRLVEWKEVCWCLTQKWRSICLLSPRRGIALLSHLLLLYQQEDHGTLFFLSENKDNSTFPSNTSQCSHPVSPGLDVIPLLNGAVVGKSSVNSLSWLLVSLLICSVYQTRRISTELPQSLPPTYYPPSEVECPHVNGRSGFMWHLF